METVLHFNILSSCVQSGNSHGIGRHHLLSHMCYTFPSKSSSHCVQFFPHCWCYYHHGPVRLIKLIGCGVGGDQDLPLNFEAEQTFELWLSQNCVTYWIKSPRFRGECVFQSSLWARFTPLNITLPVLKFIPDS